MADVPIRLVRPPALPRHPRYAVCPACGKGGGTDPTVISFESAADGKRYIACGYCAKESPQP